MRIRRKSCFEEKRMKKVFPEGAITFHKLAWSKRGMTQQGLMEAERLMKRFKFSSLFILHGNCHIVNGKVVIISGPAGVGKSSASRELIKSGGAPQVEEGKLLVGQRNGKWFLVETGTLKLSQKRSLAVEPMRKVIFAGTKKWGTKNTGIERIASDSMYWLGLTFMRGDRSRVDIKEHQVGKVVWLRDSRDEKMPLKVGSDLSISLLSGLGGEIPAGINLREFLAQGSRTELKELIKKEVLSK